MAIINTWQAEQYIAFGRRLADAYGASLQPDPVLGPIHHWTSTALTEFGHRLTQGYGVWL
jgi:hypothetical protein